MEDTLSVTQVAKGIGIAPNTVRQWTRDFADYLSEQARPPKGRERRYTADDVAVFQTVKVLRGQRRDSTTIEAVLAKGERLEPAESPPETAETPSEHPETPPVADDNALAPMDLLERFVMPLVDSLQTQLDDEREARLDAEKRAAAAEAKLEALEGRRSWWDRLRGR